MADRLRVVTFTQGGYPVVERDLSDGATYKTVRDSLTFNSAPVSPLLARSDRRYGGSKIIGETHDNASVTGTWQINAATADLALTAYENLVETLYALGAGRYLEFRPEGATRSVYMELRGPGTVEPRWRWIEFVATKTIQCQVTFATAPLAEGDRMDIEDDFTSSARLASDWRVDEGGGLGDTLSGGVFLPGGTLGTQRRYVYDERGYLMIDGQTTVRGTPPTSATSGFKLGAVVNCTAVGTYLEAYVDDNGTNGRFRIDKIIGGTRTNLTTLNLASRPSASVAEFYEVRVRRDGGGVYAECLIDQELPPLKQLITGAHGWALAGADQTTFDAGGYPGFNLLPAAAGATVTHFSYKAYVYADRLFPDVIKTRGAIPGTAPAKVDVTVTSQVAGVNPFGMIAWSKAPKPGNLVWNGDFEDASRGVSGWSVSASSLTAAATSIVRDTSSVPAKFDSATALVTLPVSGADPGAWFLLYGRFKLGTTYNFRCWVRTITSAGATVGLRVGVSGDSVNGGTATLSTSWQLITATWTPTADRVNPIIAVYQDSAGPTQLFIDGAACYEGAVAPTQENHLMGEGGAAPWGVVEAESFVPGLSNGWAVNPDATQRSDHNLILSSPTAGTQYNAVYDIDPSLLGQSDAFQAGEQRTELWLRISTPVTFVSPVLTVRAYPGAGPNAIGRPPEEEGSGRVLIPSAVGFQFVRVGVIPMAIDPRTDAPRWRLSIGLTVGVGSTGDGKIDFLLLNPARQRALTPTGKDVTSAYPTFMDVATVGSFFETSKRVAWDLQGSIANHGTEVVRNQFTPHAGLGGQLIEVDPDTSEWLVVVSNQVPDDPSPLGSMTAEGAGGAEFSVTPRYYLVRGS